MRYCIPIILSFLSIQILFGQVKTNRYSRTIISGKLPEAITSEGNRRAGVFVVPEDYKNNLKSSRKYIPLKNGCFKIDTLSNEFFYFQLMLPATKRVSYSMRGPDQEYVWYFVEPGDSVFMSISDSGYASFSGKGSEKFNCLSKISSQHLQLNRPTSEENIKGWVMYFEAKRQLELSVLQSFKTSLSSISYSLIKADIYGRCTLHQLGFLNKLVAYDRNTATALYKTCFNALPATPTKITINVKSYRTALIKKCEWQVLLNKENGERSLTLIYNRLKSQYKGLVQQMVLANYLNEVINENSPSEIIAMLIDDFKKLTHNPAYISVLVTAYENKRDTNSKGMLAINFSLPDSSGRQIRLQQFRGKVVVLDFWFTGCKGCVAFKPVLKRTIDSFSGDSNVVFISISIDDIRQQWIKGLQSGLYTSNHEVDLFTDGKGTNHPLISFYKIGSYPRVVVIDQHGRIFDSDVADSVRKNSNELIKLIRSALATGKRLSQN